MDAVQRASAESAIDRVATDARGHELRSGHDPRLLARDRANCRKLPPDSGGNLRQFGHAAMVGALAVPAQRPVCDNSAQEPPRLAARQHDDAPGAMVIRLT
jgi:hypothetical protein